MLSQILISFLTNQLHFPNTLKFMRSQSLWAKEKALHSAAKFNADRFRPTWTQVFGCSFWNVFWLATWDTWCFLTCKLWDVDLETGTTSNSSLDVICLKYKSSTKKEDETASEISSITHASHNPYIAIIIDSQPTISFQSEHSTKEKHRSKKSRTFYWREFHVVAVMHIFLLCQHKIIFFPFVFIFWVDFAFYII